MSNVVEGRNRLEALAQELKEAGSKGTAQKIMNIVKDCLYRSHIGVAQGPKSVKRASKKKDAPAKKAPAKKSEKPKAEKKVPAKVKADKPKAEKPAKTAKPKVAKPKAEKPAKAAPHPAKTAMDAGADLGSNI